MSSTRTRWPVIAVAVTASFAGAVHASAGGGSAQQAAARDQSTQLISRALDGGVPNGASTHAVISGDKRYARAIAFESDASNLVPGDVNGVRDVFAVLRAGHIGNQGSPWTPGNTILISRTRSGVPADGPSFSPAVDGGFHHRPSCVAFLSAATNLVTGDTNGRVDAFVRRLSGGPARRISLPGGSQSDLDTTAVAVSDDCKLVAFVTGGNLYVARGSRVKRLDGSGVAAQPSFSTGLRNDLVFASKRGVYLARKGTGNPRLVASGGRNPAYNDIKRRVVAYEITRGGHQQVAYRELGGRERVISSRRGNLGNGNSRDPVIGNAGYYVTFQTEASNLGVNALGREGDGNGRPDVYLYTDVRKITLVQSVREKAQPVPGGGQNPSMSFYANYIVFDSPAPLGEREGAHQVYMRYLGPV
jgi:hypothetical protein